MSANHSWYGGDLERSASGMATPSAPASRTGTPFDLNQLGFSLSVQQPRYTIGWVCALPVEFNAATAVLDEIHPTLPSREGDPNAYTFGRVHSHNVVMAILPSGGYGTNNAANVAAHMLRSFPSLRVQLMVGIAGGVPAKGDIRLGDVVISDSVIQHDMGKIVQNGDFQFGNRQCKPPPWLMTVVAKMQAKLLGSPGLISRVLTDIFQTHPELSLHARNDYPDRLFLSSYQHPIPGMTCDSCAVEQLVTRMDRMDQSPQVHVGTIASGNQVIKDALTRDRLAAVHDILCFEMEAAGMMGSFPCLSIRGICDYADSHKTKEWQPYASLSAAACAKEFLSNLSEIESAKSPYEAIDQSIGQLSKLTLDSREPENSSLSKEQVRNLRASLKFAHIDAREMTIKRAHSETCKWMLQRQEYCDWLNTDKLHGHHGLFWIKGKPGTGKSTMMKFILANARQTIKDKLIISFFFNARGDELEKSTKGMYQSLILQLLDRVPSLRDLFQTVDEAIRDSTSPKWTLESLKGLFERSIENLDGTPIICLIDALDECDEHEIRDMVRFLENLGKRTQESNRQFHFCFASRHYPHITIRTGLQLVLEGQEEHTEDIAKYVSSELRIGHGAALDGIRSDLLRKASGIFMWIVLVVEILNEEHDQGMTPSGLRKKLRDIPGDLHDLFRDILTRDEKDKRRLQICVYWMLFAWGPLEPRTLYAAIHSSMTSPSSFLAEWDPDEVTDQLIARFLLSSSKGLAQITRSETPTVQFIHESVRDFLLKENGLRTIWPDAGGDFEGQIHDMLKKCCFETIQAERSHTSINTEITNLKRQERAERAAMASQKAWTKSPLLYYAMAGALYHANEAQGCGISQSAYIEAFPRQLWIQIRNLSGLHHGDPLPLDLSLLYICAEGNFSNLIDLSGDCSSCFVIERGSRRGTAFLAARATESDEVVKKFLNSLYENLDSEWKREYDKLLRDGQPEPCYKSDMRYNPARRSLMSFLAEMGDSQGLVLLLAQDVSRVNKRDASGDTPLSWAASMGDKPLVSLLIKHGANMEIGGKSRRTALHAAVKRRHMAVVQLLLQNGANIEAKGDNDRTPLMEAGSHEPLVRLLLENGADTQAKDNLGLTMLHYAVHSWRDVALRTTQLLLDKGADINAVDVYGRTPLIEATLYGDSDRVQFLLERGADDSCTDNYGETALDIAKKEKNNALIRLLSGD